MLYSETVAKQPEDTCILVSPLASIASHTILMPRGEGDKQEAIEILTKIIIMLAQCSNKDSGAGLRLLQSKV